MKKFPVVVIIWDDASNSSEWSTEEDIDRQFCADTGWPVTTAGFLIRDHKKYAVVAGAISKAGNFNLIQRIPRGMILSMKTISK